MTKELSKFESVDWSALVGEGTAAEEEKEKNPWSALVGEGTAAEVKERKEADPSRGEIDSAKDILGALLADSNPAIRDAIAKRAALSKPVLRSSPIRARDWQVGLPPMRGEAGETKTTEIAVQALFRVEKIYATDTAKERGYGTRIVSIFVGNLNQLPPVGAGLPTWAFAPNTLGSGVKLDTCKPGMTISFTIEFLESCEWTGVLFGKGVL